MFFKKMASAMEEVIDKVEDAIDEVSEKQNETSESETTSRDASTYEENSKKAVPGLVNMFSGCQDCQTSADVSNTASFGLRSGAGGACTNALLATLKKDEDKDMTWVELLEGMREILAEKRFTQIPQLSSSRNLDVINGTFSPLHPDHEGKKKKALFIGINYVGQQGELRGCHNDVHSMKEYISNHGFDEHKILMDDGANEEPTGANIMEAFDWLVAGAEEGDSLFMHYSGHGGSTRDRDGDEKDGKDETLVPVDYQSAGQITDDQIFEHLVLKVPNGCQLTVLMDCCHSGSILDLPYMVKADDETMSDSSNIHMAQNPGFSFGKLLQVAKKLYSIHQECGGDMNTVMMAGIKELAALKF